MCALYSYEKHLPKSAPGSQGAAPGAINVWRLPTALPGWRLSKMAPCSGKRLLRGSSVELFFGVFGGILILDMYGPTTRVAPGAASLWWLPELSQSCSSRLLDYDPKRWSTVLGGSSNCLNSASNTTVVNIANKDQTVKVRSSNTMLQLLQDTGVP